MAFIGNMVCSCQTKHWAFTFHFSAYYCNVCTAWCCSTATKSMDFHYLQLLIYMKYTRLIQTILEATISLCPSISWPSLHTKVTSSSTSITHTRGLLSCFFSLGKLSGWKCLMFRKISLKNGLNALRKNLWACNWFLSLQARVKSA